MSLRQSFIAFLALGFMALNVAACGRAGPLQAPPDKNAAPQQQQKTAVDEEENEAIASPLPTPQKQPKRPITVPNRPFILDAIL